MSDKEKSNISDLIYGLERINQIIDLCIDRELYEYVDQILKPSADAQKGLAEFRDAEGEESLEQKGLHELEFPIEKIEIPTTIIPQDIVNALFRNEKPPFDLTDKKDFLFKYWWSSLFWAKRIRAELQRHNKRKWLDRYEDLNLFLESHMPCVKQDANNEVVFELTRFTFLMELSAVAQGEASFGYAERAKKLLNRIYPPEREEPEREPYDRWIWWNMGTAYQHVGRSQKAVLEFNQVIKKFWCQKPEEHKEEIESILLEDLGVKFECSFDIVLEFLFNIVPAYLQRAAINLQLQLGYHALQTLDGIDRFLKKISEDNLKNLFDRAANHLQCRIDLLRIEALLQLEQVDAARQGIEDAYPVIFPDDNWVRKDIHLLPDPDRKKTKAIQTQLIEQTVTWLLARERGGLCQNNCEAVIAELENSLKNESSQDEIGGKLLFLKEMAQCFLAASYEVKNIYWSWVEDNQFDERIYFSRWAQFLKHGSGLLKKLRTLSENEKITLSEGYAKLIKEAQIFIFEAIIPLYCDRQQKLPTPQKPKKNEHGEQNETNRLKLERFRSDDRPDFISGLSAFYKEMRTISLSNEVAQKIFKQVGVDNPFGKLRDDHCNVLAALDEFEEEFGQNQQIKALKRYNERVAWEATPEDCKGCLDTNKDIAASQKSYHFIDLLACLDNKSEGNSKKDSDIKDDVLYCEDYQNIMRKAESLFTKHLEIPSLQKPARKSVHFVGLQRWNSLTPAQGRSVGGGYLIYRTNGEGQVDLGIAVDPGFDFVRNLFRMGFSLRDIDIVIISHAHPDHLWDFETMVQLLHELESKKDIIHRLNVIMTLGSYKRLDHIIKNPKLRSFINPLVVDICKEVDPLFWHNINHDPTKYSFNFFGTSVTSKKRKNNQRLIRWQPVLPLPDDPNKNKTEIAIQPTWAYHEDYTEISDSFGFKINIIESDTRGNSHKFSFGYTGDTKWVGEDLYPVELWENVASQYEKCDVMLMHIGSLINHKKGEGFEQYTKNNGACAKLIRKENHLYLMGIIRFLKKLGYPKIPPDFKNQKLILLGEFGEELRGGIRTDLVKRLQGDALSNWPILPVDVGFDVLLYDYRTPNQSYHKNAKESDDGFKFLCALCDEHRPIKEIDYCRFGQDEAIFYICKTCIKATPADVRQTQLRQLYDIGRELRTLPDPSQ